MCWTLLKGKPGRVCPLVCDHGFRADGDQCTKIVCRAGHRISDDNECEKIPEKKPVATLAMNPQGVNRTGKRVSHRRLLHKQIRPARSYAQMPAAGRFVPAASWDDRRALPLTVAA